MDAYEKQLIKIFNTETANMVMLLICHFMKYISGN